MDEGGLFAPHVLREYALLADGERGILVGPRGDAAWMCFPRWESDAVFSSLVGGGSVYAVSPVARSVWGGFYEPRTLIWHSRWVTDDNVIVECREALVLPGEVNRAVLLRRVLALAGTARVEIVLHPRGGFGRVPFDEVHRDEAGTWRGRIGEIAVAWAGAEGARPEADIDGGERLVLDLELAEGARHDLVLVLADGDADRDPPDAREAWAATEEQWHRRVPSFEQTIAPRDAAHACAVLTGLTSAGGGMVAAATMGLPERADEGRNYDYRYVWIRDQCFAGRAAARAGVGSLLDDAVRFVSERLLADGPELRPAYTTSGGRVPLERRVGLVGYPGGSDIAGNNASEQFQLDGYGEALLLLSEAAGQDRLDSDGWRAAEAAAEAVEARWQERDSGIWELEPDEWTHSRLICAAGLRAVSAAGPGGGPSRRWLALADAVTADASARMVHPSGRWQRSPGDDRLDASLLLPALRGAVASGDPRTIATLDSFVRELTEDGYAFRFRPDARPLGEAEGSFLLCGFILALALDQQGETVRAARWFERNRAACGPPGLLAEEFDVEQRQLRGNLPQAFVHALLLECAATLDGAGPSRQG